MNKIRTIFLAIILAIGWIGDSNPAFALAGNGHDTFVFTQVMARGMIQVRDPRSGVAIRSMPNAFVAPTSTTLRVIRRANTDYADKITGNRLPLTIEIETNLDNLNRTTGATQGLMVIAPWSFAFNQDTTKAFVVVEDSKLDPMEMPVSYDSATKSVQMLLTPELVSAIAQAGQSGTVLLDVVVAQSDAPAE